MAKKKSKKSESSAPEGRPPRQDVAVESGDPDAVEGGSRVPDQLDGDAFENRLSESEGAEKIVEAMERGAEEQAAGEREPVGQPSEDELAAEMREQASEEGTYEGDGPEPGERVPLEELGADPSETTIEITVAGESKEVTLEEAAKGYQRHEDYTRKTQEVAETRRELEQARERVKSDLEALSMIGEQLPEQAVRALQQKYAEYTQQIEQETEAQRTERLENERERLREALDWQSEEEAREGAERLQQYIMSEYGYTPEDLRSVHDHRVMTMAEKARRYDAARGKMEEVRSKRKESPTLEPGSTSRRSDTGRGDQFSEAMSRLQQSGSKRDGAAAIQHLLE